MSEKEIQKGISIVIPVYNTPREMLLACADSIRAQSYQNFEVIMIDDGSGDATAEILDSLAKSDLRFRVFHQENSGAGAARNSGIDKAAGKYITFVDADDLIDKHFLQYAFNLAEKNNLDIVYGGVRICDMKDAQLLSDTESNKQIEYKIYSKNEIYKIQELFLLNDSKKPISGLSYLDFGPCGKLFRKSVIGQIRFPIDISLGEDQVFNHSILHQCNTCAICDKIAYFYIDNSNSISHNWVSDAVSIMINVMTKIRDMLLNESPEMMNDYYVSFLRNLYTVIAIQFYSSNSPYKNFKMKRKESIKVFKQPLVAEAMDRINLSSVKKSKTKLMVALIKYKVYPYFMELRVYQKMRYHRKQNKYSDKVSK